MVKGSDGKGGLAVCGLHGFSLVSFLCQSSITCFYIFVLA